jgi:hypothetical protein
MLKIVNVKRARRPPQPRPVIQGCVIGVGVVESESGSEAILGGVGFVRNF